MKHLIGKEVEYKTKYFTATGIVVAIDINRGITIVREDDPAETFICLHGPTAPLGNQHAPYYEEYFSHVVKCIEDGELIDTTDLFKIRMAYSDNRLDRFSTIASCAFS